MSAIDKATNIVIAVTLLALFVWTVVTDGLGDALLWVVGVVILVFLMSFASMALAALIERHRKRRGR